MTCVACASVPQLPEWPDKPGFPLPPGVLVAYREYNANVYDTPKIWRRNGIFRCTHRQRHYRLIYYFASADGDGVSRKYMTSADAHAWISEPDVVVVREDLLPDPSVNERAEHTCEDEERSES